MIVQAANRLNTVGAYYFATKLSEIARRNKAGAKIINLGIGSPDLAPPPEVLRELAVQSISPAVNGYQSYQGVPELRKAFAQWYAKFYAVDLDFETEVLPLMGSKEGVMHVSLAFLNPGDKVLVPDPGYPTYSNVAGIVGAEVIKYNLHAENGWLPDFEALGKMDLEKVKIMWLNYPHMPTGAGASKDLFARVVKFARKHNILVVNDNPYSFILNNEPLSIFCIPDAREVALELNSLSKSHNMAVWRLGMVAGKSDYIKQILAIKSNMDSGMYKPVQLAAAKALQVGPEWYESVNVVYRRRKILAGQIFDALQVTYTADQSGLFLWGKIPEAYNGSYDFCDGLVNDSKVFLTPGSIFGENGKNYMRISLCSPCEIFEEALQRIINNKKN